MHAPLNPENWKPEPAVAVSVTEVPDVKLAAHVVGQLIPAGLLVTVPVPVIVTVRLKFLGGGGGVFTDVPPQAVRTNRQARETAKANNRRLKDANLYTAHFLGAERSSWVACCWMRERFADGGFPGRDSGYPVDVVRDSEPERERAGLCADCRYMRLITSDRGAAFYLCQRSASDKSFPKYPRLPVIQCRGYEPEPSSDPEC